MNKITMHVGGKDRVFKFDMYAMELFIDNASFKGQFQFIAKMLYAGLSSACYSKEMENDFTFEDVVDIVDELALSEEGKEKLKMLNDCMAESQAYKSLLEKAKETDEKKTLSGIEFTPSPLVKSA